MRLMMLLDESGERRQGELVSFLGVEAYELSRLLTKLETALGDSEAGRQR